MTVSRQFLKANRFFKEKTLLKVIKVKMLVVDRCVSSKTAEGGSQVSNMQYKDDVKKMLMSFRATCDEEIRLTGHC